MLGITAIEMTVIVVIVAIAIIALTPRYGLVSIWRRTRRRAERTLFEDALRHIREFEERGLQATRESVAGSLDISSKRSLAISRMMRQRGLIEYEGPALRLTPRGAAMALELTRAHRIWESYLADEAGVGLDQIHDMAHREEHRSAPETVDRMEAQLGFPRYDPHGDLIPWMGDAEEDGRDCVLIDWPVGRRAIITHIEDDERSILVQILSLGLLPGTVIEIMERDDSGTRIRTPDGESWLASVFATSINVVEAPPEPEEDVMRLSALEPGDLGTVVTLDSRGLTRRRFMDLGVVPGTAIESVMEAVFGEPTAYRVRDTLIALRKEQANQIWIRPVEKNGSSPRISDEVKSL